MANPRSYIIALDDEKYLINFDIFPTFKENGEFDQLIQNIKSSNKTYDATPYTKKQAKGISVKLKRYKHNAVVVNLKQKKQLRLITFKEILSFEFNTRSYSASLSELQNINLNPEFIGHTTMKGDYYFDDIMKEKSFEVKRTRYAMELMKTYYNEYKEKISKDPSYTSILRDIEIDEILESEY